MITPERRGMFVAEGTSDAPLADVVENLFLERRHPVTLSRPDFGLLAATVNKDVRSKLQAGRDLTREPIDVLVVHRDADGSGPESRQMEIVNAVHRSGVTSQTPRLTCGVSVLVPGV